MPRPEILALSGNWKALLVSPNRGIATDLAQLLSHHLPRLAYFEMTTYPNRQVLAELGGASGPNLCFLDLITDVERGLQLIGELISIQPAMKVVVVLASKAPEIILRAMRQGAVEFLVRPLDAVELEGAIERLATMEAGKNGKSQGRIVAIAPAKGACGASTVAANIAQSIKRQGFKKILVADMDPLTGTLSFLLKLKSSYSFVDALNRSGSLDVDLWKGMVANSAGVDVLLAPDQVQDNTHHLKDASEIIEFARTHYEVVVFDLGSVYGDWNLSLARGADDLLLVTTNELPSLQAAQRALTYLESNRVSRSKVRLLVNRYSKEFGLGREVIETALHSDIYHLLPSDFESVQAALIEGKSIPPSTSLGKSLSQLAERLCGKTETVAAPAKKTSALGTLLSLFTK